MFTFWNFLKRCIWMKICYYTLWTCMLCLHTHYDENLSVANLSPYTPKSVCLQICAAIWNLVKAHTLTKVRHFGQNKRGTATIIQMNSQNKCPVMVLAPKCMQPQHKCSMGSFSSKKYAFHTHYTKIQHIPVHCWKHFLKRLDKKYYEILITI